MIESYSRHHEYKDDLLRDGLVDALEEFVATRECWLYSKECAPALEVHFSATKPCFYKGEIDVQLTYSWFPPVVEFTNLQNTALESEGLVIKPAVSTTQPFSNLSNVDVEYYIGPSGDWLEWDDRDRCFHGRIPRSLASAAGVERNDMYTIPLELLTTIVKHFPDGIRYETVIRCALPLTIKRRPDFCRSPTDEGPLKSAEKKYSMLAVDGKSWPLGTDARLCDHKPTQVTSLRTFLAATVVPHRDLTPLEVRTARIIYDRSDPTPRTPGTASTATGGELLLDLGSTHVNRRGELDSESDVGTPLESPAADLLTLSPVDWRRGVTQSNTSKRRCTSHAQSSAEKLSTHPPQMEDSTATPTRRGRLPRQRLPRARSPSMGEITASLQQRIAAVRSKRTKTSELLIDLEPIPAPSRREPLQNLAQPSAPTRPTSAATRKRKQTQPPIEPQNSDLPVKQEPDSIVSPPRTLPTPQADRRVDEWQRQIQLNYQRFEAEKKRSDSGLVSFPNPPLMRKMRREQLRSTSSTAVNASSAGEGADDDYTSLTSTSGPGGSAVALLASDEESLPEHEGWSDAEMMETDEIL